MHLCTYQNLGFSFKQGLRVVLVKCGCGGRRRRLINSCFFSTCTASDSTFHLGWNPHGHWEICVYVAAPRSLRTRLLTAALLKMEVGPCPQRKGGRFILYLYFILPTNSYTHRLLFHNLCFSVCVWLLSHEATWTHASRNNKRVSCKF